LDSSVPIPTTLVDVKGKDDMQANWMRVAGSCVAAVLTLPLLPGLAHGAAYKFGTIEPLVLASQHPYPDGAPGGTAVWSQSLVRPDAAALMLHFSALSLGSGDRLEVRDGGGNLIASYDGQQRARWSPVVPGDRLVLTLVADEHGSGFGVETDQIAVRTEAEPETLCEDDLDDFTCYDAGETCADAAKFNTGEGVARLHVSTDQGNLCFCTGFLIDHANRDDLLMTAGHCLLGTPGCPGNATAISVEFDAVYTPDCRCENGPATAACDIMNNACDSPDSGARDLPCSGPVCDGLTWTPDPNGDCDWGLIKCDEDAPAGATNLPLNGFDPNSETVYIVQHPRGRCKEIDIDPAANNVTTCTFDHCVDTEGGSSGSPVTLVSSDEVIGVHVLGGCSTTLACPPNANSATRMAHILPELAAAVQIVLCGDGVLDAGEACDPAQQGSCPFGQVCESDCSACVAGPLPGTRCAADKMNATGKKAKSKLNCHAKATAAGTSVSMSCLDAAEQKFANKFASVEARGGCNNLGDAPVIEGKVDAFVADVVAELPDGGTDAGRKCAAAKLRVVAKTAAAKLKCHAKALRKNLAPDPACLAKASQSFSRKWDQIEDRGGCATTGDKSIIKAKIDAFVADVVAEVGSPSGAFLDTDTGLFD
jgi:V8-like Glu-specific endopeptidase